VDDTKYISNKSVARLWNDFRTGNEDSYTNLMKIFANPMFRYGIRFVRNEDFVKDCIQDIFFELWNRRDKIRQAESVKAYLFKALRLRIFRERSKWESSESLDENYEFIIEFDVEANIIKQEVSKEICLKLHKILDSLPKRQKEIMYLRFYEGMDQDKIAEVMGLNRQSVYNLLHESIIRLRKYWLKSPVYYCL
jgi:RNA polymerase sigma factor (sigma-70 family)